MSQIYLTSFTKVFITYSALGNFIPKAMGSPIPLLLFILKNSYSNYCLCISNRNNDPKINNNTVSLMLKLNILQM